MAGFYDGALHTWYNVSMPALHPNLPAFAALFFPRSGLLLVIAICVGLAVLVAVVVALLLILQDR